MSLEPDTRPTAVASSFAIRPLVNAGLADPDGYLVRFPKLAEAVPSLENGLWKLFPDGRMETTWRLRDGVRWHDGAPFTSDDLLFSLQVGRDGDLAGFNSPAYASIDEVSALDPRTLVVTWTQPYIDADALLGLPLAPLPKHLLEQAYHEDKASLLDLPYWTQAFVGTGPYRLRTWATGVGVQLEANPDFVLGRPRIDEIELRYIPDGNTLSANLLAGTVDVTGQMGLDLALQLRNQWREGTVVFNPSGNMITLFPQFVDPHPAIVADLRFRRALVHALDRQEIVDTLVGGMSPVAHSFLRPNQPQYREIEASLPRYDYDPRRAAEQLQELGYGRDSGGIYRDAAGERLEVEVRAAATQAAEAVADYWKRFGVSANRVALPDQRRDDREYTATFPAFWIGNQVNDTFGLRRLHSSATPLPSNNFRVAGGNVSRYINPDFDALLDAYFRTVPVPERIQVLGQIIRHMAGQVTLVGLYYNPAPGAIANRVLHVSHAWPGTAITWNAYHWDVSN
jgi:peptide/nickel transport system substrate-binding protein